MKKFLSFLFLVTCFTSFAQTAEEAAVKDVVTGFFEAFHRQDSVALQSFAHPSVNMQSLGNNAEGKLILSTNTYGEFLKRITSIPSSTKFEEKLHGFDVRVNGPLATVITPYSFLVNGNLSHCGVNSFTMVKETEEWKIIHIIDTRSREGCDRL